jgi:hypothetical protein
MKRRFTEDEDRIIRTDYPAHVPTIEIARKLQRDEGTVRQRILYLGLRRSAVATKMLGWAPDHLKGRLEELGAEQFIKACYEWRDEQKAMAAHAGADAEKAACDAIEKAAAEIDARHDISRDQKMIAKRLAGMTLEEIAQQHGVTRERVRQIVSPDFKRPNYAPTRSVAEKIRLLEAKRDALIAAQTGQLIATWDAAPQIVRDAFLKHIGDAIVKRETTG